MHKEKRQINQLLNSSLRCTPQSGYLRNVHVKTNQRMKLKNMYLQLNVSKLLGERNKKWCVECITVDEITPILAEHSNTGNTV